MDPTFSGALARERRNDLLRAADEDRLALAVAPRPPRERHARRRLGLLLVAAGNRLICPPHQTC